jgi:GT2 family glycosyltransferase
MSDSAQLSLIVCTYRRPKQLGQLLDAVVQQCRVPDETLIVDSSSDDKTKAVVQNFQKDRTIPNLHYYQVPPEHRGLTRQRNFGIARADGDIIAFLDDDTIPEVEYFTELLSCFSRHPGALGIGGYITNEVEWRQVNGHKSGPRSSVFRWEGWERREDYRWRARKLFGLAGLTPPGHMPASGHGRSVSFLPHDGQDYKVEFAMGGAFAWKSEVLKRHQFSQYFEGYGLYEDLDFCIRASRDGPLYLCTRARLAHYHAPLGRPNHFRYGEMVVRNGWYVWKKRWPGPHWADRARWWATTILLISCRTADILRGRAWKQALADASGRIWGIATLLWDKPGRLHEQ